MALINHRTREIHFKIVYYGCGLCGKTTNLKSLHDKLPAERRGKLISIATDHERTLFFDFLPIDLGQVNGFLTRFHLYTVPGQVYYKLSRRAVLQGVDGLIFVADSHPSREAANRDSLGDLQEHLKTLGITGPALARIPWVMQYNKRDLPAALPIERLRAALNPQGWPEFEAVASDGRGVSESLRAMCKAVLSRLATGTVAPTHAADPPAAAPAVVGAVAVPPVAASAAAAVPVVPVAPVLAAPAAPAAASAPRPAAMPAARRASAPAAPASRTAPRPAPRTAPLTRPAVTAPVRTAPAAAPSRPTAPSAPSAPSTPSSPAAAPYRSPRFPMPRPLTAAPSSAPRPAVSAPGPASLPFAPRVAAPHPPAAAPRPATPATAPSAPGPSEKPRQL